MGNALSFKCLVWIYCAIRLCNWAVNCVVNKKDDMPIVDVHGKKALNFQITMMIAYFVCFLLMFVVIGVILLPIVAIFSFVMVIIAAVKANDGKEFDYPLSLNLIK